MKIKDLTLMSILLTLLIICSKLTIQIGPIPLTLQTFCVIIIDFILKIKKSMIVFASYILMGIIGIPVFSSGGGFGYIFYPSFGFIIEFFLSCLITGLNISNKKIFLFLQELMGLLIIDIVGIIYMYFIMNYYLELDKSLSYIISVRLIPFLIKDIASVLISTIVYIKLIPAIKKDN